MNLFFVVSVVLLDFFSAGISSQAIKEVVCQSFVGQIIVVGLALMTALLVILGFTRESDSDD